MAYGALRALPSQRKRWPGTFAGRLHPSSDGHPNGPCRRSLTGNGQPVGGTGTCRGVPDSAITERCLDSACSGAERRHVLPGTTASTSARQICRQHQIQTLRHGTQIQTTPVQDNARPSASEARHLQDIANRGDREFTEIARLGGASQANLQVASSSGP